MPWTYDRIGDASEFRLHFITGIIEVSGHFGDLLADLEVPEKIKRTRYNMSNLLESKPFHRLSRVGSPPRYGP